MTTLYRSGLRLLAGVLLFALAAVDMPARATFGCHRSCVYSTARRAPVAAGRRLAIFLHTRL